MAWLDELLSQSGAVPGGGFQWDEAKMAEEARQAAAQRLAAAGKRPQAGINPGVMEGAAVPYSMGMLSPMGMNWPQAPQSPIQATPEPAPSTNDPLSREPVPYKDGVPLPRARPDNLDGPSPMSLAPTNPTPEDGTALPQGATPTVGMPPPATVNQSPPGAPGGGGILGKIFNPANAPMLLAMGGGFAGAPSFGTGMRRGFSAAAPQAALLRNEQLKLEGQTATMRALKAKGVPDAEIAAAVLNPDIMKGTIAKYFETKPLAVHDITGPLGDKTPVVFNPNTGKFHDMSGKEMTGAETSGGAGMGELLAPGVKFDPNKTGDEYLGQFSKDVQASVKAYMNGDVLPTGNPRQKAIATYAKTVAQRYGQDMGIPVSDATFSEKRKYRTELGSNSPNSAGGQGKAFVQAVEHADALATKLERLGNYDPLGIPGVARGINWTREAFSTKQAGIAKEAQSIGQTLAGEVGKLFSGAAGGGVHERELTRNRFNTVSSPAELAGALEGTIETMQGGLRALEQRRDEVLGPGNDVKFTTKETEAKIARIQDVIARLKGEQPAATAPRLAPGQSTTINGVTIKRLD